jgi:hypothetical protein
VHSACEFDADTGGTRASRCRERTAIKTLDGAADGEQRRFGPRGEQALQLLAERGGDLIAISGRYVLEHELLDVHGDLAH